MISFLFLIKIFLFVCFGLVFLCYFILMLRLCNSWLKMPAGCDVTQTPKVHISVIVPVRNEAALLSSCLESIIHQNYPPDLFEIIVIDDDSTDGTVSLVEKIIHQHPGISIRLLTLERDSSLGAHKKRSISKGIDASEGELIVTTDGDCVQGTGWLRCIASCSEKYTPSLIIGPVAFHQEKGFFGRMQTLEFAGLMAATGASAGLGTTLMCNGANLAYPKKIFEEVGGFTDDTLASGDDVMLMEKIRIIYPHNIHFLKSPQALVYTPPQESPLDFLNQRKRWASKFRHYGSGKIGGTALLVYCCNLLLILGTPICFIIRDFMWVYLILAGGKLIIDFLFLFLAISFTNRRTLAWLYPIEWIIYPYYVVLSGFLGVASRYEWKGRKI
jgi:cellulose synthase/poly-beta-1,6-N-acetylglucosamine synthase-like glycosyltransferase